MAIGRTNASVGGGGSQIKALIDGKGNSSKFLFYMFTGDSVNNIISYNDTENLINMSETFYFCPHLKSIPLLDTSKVTNMKYAFYNCQSLITIPQLDTSNVTDMGYMLYQCNKLTSIPLLNTSNVTDMGETFYGCNKLTTIPALDVSKVDNMQYIFQGCYKLKSIEMTGMKVDFDISSSTEFSRNALVVILNNLATVSTSQTLTMGAENLAKLTEEDKAIATNKGWTLA